MPRTAKAPAGMEYDKSSGAVIAKSPSSAREKIQRLEVLKRLATLQELVSELSKRVDVLESQNSELRAREAERRASE